VRAIGNCQEKHFYLVLSEACIVEMELEAIGHEYGLPPKLVIQARLLEFMQFIWPFFNVYSW